jgi:RNA polymerase sigma factor (sigma-70 family)
MPRDRRSDQQLLECARAGDADAFGELFARHADAVVAYLRKRTASAELAADLTAETFAEALLAVHRGRAEQVPNGIAWLLGIARHKLIDSYRSADAQDLARAEIGLPRLEIDDAELERIDRLAGREQPAVAALERLSVDEREAIVERILRERNYEEIARDLGHGEATIRKRVSRGLARMRQQMGAQIP